MRSGSEVWSVGIDLGGKSHRAVICNEAGEEVKRVDLGRGRTGLEALREAVGGHESVYIVEAAQNFWQELVHPLDTAGESVYLVSPTKCSDLRKFYRRYVKTDTTDAQAIARLAILDGRLRPAWVGTPEQESLKRLCRLSWKLTEELCNRKRRIATLLEMVLPGIGGVWKNRYCQSARLFYRRYLDPARAKRLGRSRLAAMLRRRAWGKFSAKAEEALWQVIQNAPELRYRRDDLTLEIQTELDLIEAVERKNVLLRERIDELYTEVDPDRLLETVPGIGPFFAAALTSVIGDIDRWKNASQLVAASGLVPRRRESSGQAKENQPLTQQGNPQFRSWLYVAAELTRHLDPELGAFFRRLRKRGLHHKAAICAVATKLLRRIYAVLRDRKAYRYEKQEKHARRSRLEVIRGRLIEDEDVASPNSNLDDAFTWRQEYRGNMRS
jgi:transposase